MTTNSWRQVQRSELQAAILEQLLGGDNAAIEVPEHSTPAQRADLVADKMLEQLAEVKRWWWRDAT